MESRAETAEHAAPVDDRRIFQQLTEILTRGYRTSPDPESGAMDLAALRQGVDALGEADAAALLDRITADLDAVIRGASYETRESYEAHAETLSAVAGRDRQRISQRFGNNAQAAIRAFGALPLAEGESVADRHRQLRWSEKQASKFGTQRRANHLVCVRAALEHLAQVGGYPNAARMEVALDIDLAAEAADPAAGWDVEDYRLSLELDGTDAVLVVERGGKRLKTLPKAVRSAADYAEARELQDQLRAQARRLRLGLLEPLVSEGTPTTAADLAALLRLPAGRRMIPSLIWRTPEGTTGLLEAADTDQDEQQQQQQQRLRQQQQQQPRLLLLRTLDGAAEPVTGDLHAAHPWDLHAAGTLGAWQREIVNRRIVQPVRQAFRELYLLTTAESESATAPATASARFAGRRVTGARAERLLASRSWRIEGGEDDGVAIRRFGDCQARLAFDGMGHYLGEGDAVTGTLSFRRAERTIPLTQVPPTVLSEAMRDIDLMVSVAARGPNDGPSSTAAITARGELLTALAENLGLANEISVDDTVARVRGKRAAYRVDLGNGSVYIEPHGYPCIVPDTASALRARELFLPFADEDVFTNAILSKVLMLTVDDRITDPAINAQIDRATA